MSLDLEVGLRSRISVEQILQQTNYEICKLLNVSVSDVLANALTCNIDQNRIVWVGDLFSVWLSFAEHQPVEVSLHEFDSGSMISDERLVVSVYAGRNAPVKFLIAAGICLSVSKIQGTCIYDPSNRWISLDSIDGSEACLQYEDFLRAMSIHLRDGSIQQRIQVWHSRLPVN